MTDAERIAVIEKRLEIHDSFGPVPDDERMAGDWFAEDVRYLLDALAACAKAREEAERGAAETSDRLGRELDTLKAEWQQERLRVMEAERQVAALREHLVGVTDTLHHWTRHPGDKWETCPTPICSTTRALATAPGASGQE